MKLAIFGATGQTGRLLLAEARRRGHEVTAFARDPASLEAVPGGVGVVRGDARDREAVLAAVAGQDAVITAIAGGKGDPTVQTDAVTTIAAAMRAEGVARLVTTSAYGPVATRPFVVARVVRRIFDVTFADQLRADAVVAGSELDWTVVRPTRLTNGGPGASRLDTRLFARGPWSISRRALAGTLLDLTQDGRHVGETVNLTRA